MIYLCRNKRNGFVKIGFTTNPKHREKTLQSEEPEVFFERIYEGTLDQEQDIHRRFSDRRIRGEWFELSPEDIDAIDGILGDPNESGRRDLIEQFTKLVMRFPAIELNGLLDTLNGVAAGATKDNPPAMCYESDITRLDALNDLWHDWIKHENPVSDEKAFGKLREVLS